MARPPNYSQQKHQREQTAQRKREAKDQRRQLKKAPLHSPESDGHSESERKAQPYDQCPIGTG